MGEILRVQAMKIFWDMGKIVQAMKMFWDMGEIRVGNVSSSVRRERERCLV